MNKTALMNYALFARKELEAQIALSLNRLGIYQNSIKKANVVGDYTIIEGTEETFPKRVYTLRQQIISEHIQPNGFKSVVEEFAYSWFNRIIALRFMEVHDYFEHGFRVLTSRDGSYEPEILKNVMYLIDSLSLNQNVVQSLYKQNKTEELYRYVLFHQCNKLSDILPMLFSTQESYMELLLPNNLLADGSVIRQIEEVPEEDFKNDIEVIGWLYQFYNSVKKDEVNDSKKIITKDTLPAVTQLFTPDWIVRYMAQNSVGRKWLEAFPNSQLKQEMSYYVEDPEQPSEVINKINSETNQISNPADIKIMEPCCGSGHILVYVFDLLLNMYQEMGYQSRDIPGLILKNNLYGLDVDKRAAQLSQFALIMKARSIDNRFFHKERFVLPHVLEIQDSKILFDLDYKDMAVQFGFSTEARNTLDYLAKTFENGKIIGSLLKVAKKNYENLITEAEHISENYVPNLLQTSFSYYGLPRIIELAHLANILANKYDIVITNPPYCGISRLESTAKDYFIKNYPTSKNDMFSMFMETNLLKDGGLLSMINMQSWMFLSSYEPLRKELFSKYSVCSMLHLGPGAFEEISGEVVQVTSFVFQKTEAKGRIAKYFRLVEQKTSEKESNFSLRKNEYLCNGFHFDSIPGKRWIYWFKDTGFFKNRPVSECYFSGGRNKTHNNAKYVRMNWEVSSQKKRWKKYDDGGISRKWFGNCTEVVDWSDEATKFYASHGGLLSDTSIKKIGISWNIISAYHYCFKLKPIDFAFSSSSPTIIPFNENNDDLLITLGALNSCVGRYVFTAIDPTVHLSVGEILQFPIAALDGKRKNDITALVRDNIRLSILDWNTRFISPWFSDSPFVNPTPELTVNSTDFSQEFLDYLVHDQADKSIDYKDFASLSLVKRFDIVSSLFAQRKKRIIQNETILNKLYLEAYQIDDDIDDSIQDVTMQEYSHQQASIDLMEYCCGVVLGLYRHPYKEQYETSVYAPVYNIFGIDNSLCSKVLHVISDIFGSEHYQENINFIANGLFPLATDKSPEELINDYLNNNYYLNHVKTYQKLPPIWQLSSGKKGAFKCFVNSHSYNENTLASINAKVFLPSTVLYKGERQRLEGILKVQENSKQAKAVQTKLQELDAKEAELFLYGQLLDHLANSFTSIDESKGIKSNYASFQNQEILVNGRTEKLNLLAALK